MHTELLFKFTDLFFITLYEQLLILSLVDHRRVLHLLHSCGKPECRDGLLDVASLWPNIGNEDRLAVTAN